MSEKSAKVCGRQRAERLLKELATTRHEVKDLVKKLVPKLDPDGVNVFTHVLLHNDVEVRCLASFKVRDTMTPFAVFLAIPLSTWNHLPDYPPDEIVQNAKKLKAHVGD